MVINMNKFYSFISHKYSSDFLNYFRNIKILMLPEIVIKHLEKLDKFSSFYLFIKLHESLDSHKFLVTCSTVENYRIKKMINIFADLICSNKKICSQLKYGFITVNIINQVIVCLFVDITYTNHRIDNDKDSYPLSVIHRITKLDHKSILVLSRYIKKIISSNKIDFLYLENLDCVLVSDEDLEIINIFLKVKRKIFSKIFLWICYEKKMLYDLLNFDLYKESYANFEYPLATVDNNIIIKLLNSALLKLTIDNKFPSH